jgi:NAD(P)H-dependent FMN reductase
MLHLQAIVVSTRQGRVGDAVARWFFALAQRDTRWTSELIDLAEVNLPLFDEPRHPRFQRYEHEHTRRWSEIVSRADAYVFVTPEYNYGTPPSLVNALDYVLNEWAYKPCGFVSYGGVSGGSRSVQMTKQIVTTLRMMPIPEAVTIPFFAKMVDQATHTFTATEPLEQAAGVMLGELHRWASALKPLRG